MNKEHTEHYCFMCRGKYKCKRSALGVKLGLPCLIVCPKCLDFFFLANKKYSNHSCVKEVTVKDKGGE